MAGLADSGTCGVSMRWTSRDRHFWFTRTAAIGALSAAALAAFGLPPVDLHGALHRFGIMDPLCGGTRAVRYAMRGQWVESWRYNPLGILLMFGLAMVLARAVVGMLSGRWLDLAASSGWRRGAAVVGVVLLAVLEVRQQLRSDLLIQP